jgi:hypothetical protein
MARRREMKVFFIFLGGYGFLRDAFHNIRTNFVLPAFFSLST